MRSKDIESILVKKYSGTDWGVRFRCQGFYEADFVVMKNNFLYEFEIKTSEGDLQNDFTKKTKKHLFITKPYPVSFIDENNYVYHAPNYFSFICSFAPVTPIPPEYGLIICNNASMTIVREPKKIHSFEVPEYMKAKLHINHERYR